MTGASSTRAISAGRCKLLLSIEEHTYPDGEKWGTFFIGREHIGTADKFPDGWRVRGKRKILPAEMAAKAMIDSAISQAKQDEKRARRALEALRTYCGGSLPADGKMKNSKQ